MIDNTKKAAYGTSDVSFQAAGREEGIKKLTNDFYDFMETIPSSRKILEMHPKDLEVSRDKLFRFLCGWLGGPRLYQEKYGPMTIPGVHAHLSIGTDERDQWLLCMGKALEIQSYDEDFKAHLNRQFSFPAERVRNKD